MANADCTAELSPPPSCAPHVTMDPLCRTAANALADPCMNLTSVSIGKEPFQRGCDLPDFLLQLATYHRTIASQGGVSPGDKRPFLRDSCKCIRVALNIHNALKSVLDHRAVSSITRGLPKQPRTHPTQWQRMQYACCESASLPSIWLGQQNYLRHTTDHPR